MNFNIPKQYRHFQRYQQIAQILLKNGLGFVVDRLDLKKFLPFKKRLNIDQKMDKQTLATRLRRVLQELGPTYIKLGQLISTRPDLLSPDFIKELRKLQDKVRPIHFKEIEKIIITELGENYQQFFQIINKIPRATASIAQTHKAVLNDGSEVILKIQCPDIKKRIMVDLEILYNLARLAEDRKLISNFVSPTQIVNEFRDTMLKELDFKREVANMDKFRNNFADNPAIIIPRVYKDLSSSRLIVMEEIKGIKLNELTPEHEKNLDLSLLANLGARAFMKQIFIDGFFHGDPHPGNIFIVEQSKLAYIDFGLMGQLSQEVQTQFSLLFIALMLKKTDVIVDVIVDIGVVPPGANIKKLELEIQDLINKYYGRDLADIKFVLVFDDFQRIIHNFNIKMPRDFFLLIRAIAVSEGVGFSIDPSFNIVKTGEDFMVELLGSRLKPGNIFNFLLRKIWKLRNSTKKVPRKMGEILDKINNDRFTINFKHLNLEGLINKLDIISNRLSISLIISALIIGSSMILQTEMQPRFFNMPILGFVGYIIAGILGFFLVIAIMRSGKF